MDFLFQLRGGILKRVLGKLLKTILGALGVVIVAAIAAIVCVLVFPQALIQDRWLGRAARLASRAGVELSWDRGHVEVESLRLLSKRVHLEFDHLCARVPREGWSG